MRIEGKTSFPVDRDSLFRAFFDQDILKKSIPGCKTLEEVGDGIHKVTMAISVGPVKGEYQGVVDVSDNVFPERIRLVGEGDGKQGFAKGDGILVFSADGTSTQISYSGDVEVGGIIVSVGQRVLKGVAKFLIGQFLKRINKNISIAKDKTGIP
ncbi:MAG: carbon monoxide dehydrogenase subunit G [Pseudomonadota bacterium]